MGQEFRRKGCGYSSWWITIKAKFFFFFSFVSQCSHVWCRSRRFDCILLVFFRRWGRSSFWSYKAWCSQQSAGASSCKITTLLSSRVTFTYIRWSKILWSKIVCLLCKAWARLKWFSFNLEYQVPLSLFYHCSSVFRDTRKRWNMVAVYVLDRHFVVEIVVF